MGDLFSPEQAESVLIGGVQVIFRMSGRDTDGAYEVLEFRLEPGLIPPHAHRPSARSPMSSRARSGSGSQGKR